MLGIAAVLVAGAQASPLAHWADTRSFAAHMAQHLLIGDLAPLAFVIGLRRTVRRIVSPLLTWPVWSANLAVWHVPVVYEAALHHEVVHAFQHVALFAAGVLLWTPVFGLAATPRWFDDPARLFYLLLTMFAGVVLGAIFLWWPHAIYSTYAHARGLAGLSARVHFIADAGTVSRFSPTRTSAAVFETPRTTAVTTSGWGADAPPRSSSAHEGSLYFSGSTPSATRLRGLRNPDLRSCRRSPQRSASSAQRSMRGSSVVSIFRPWR